MLERDSGPRPEARKEEKGNSKVAKVGLGFAGCGENMTNCGKSHQGTLEQESERC